MGVGIGILFGERFRNRGQIGLRLGDGRARFQSRHGLEAVHATLFRGRLRVISRPGIFRDRNVEISGVVLDRELKTGRQHADHGMRTPVKRDGAPNHVWIVAEMFFPKLIRDDDLESAGAAAGLLVLARKSATHLWLDAHYVEKLRASFYAMQTGRSFVAGQRERLIAIDRDTREGAILVAEIEEVRIGQRAEIRLVFLARVGHADGDELIGLRKWKRFQQDRVDDAEDGGVRADPQREGEDRDDGERGVLDELA